MVLRYIDDGQPYGGPAEWPTALQGSAGAFPGVDYAALAAAVRPQFEDAGVIASARTRAIVVIHRVSYGPEDVLLCVAEVCCWALGNEASSVGCSYGRHPGGPTAPLEVVCSCAGVVLCIKGCHGKVRASGHITLP